MKEDATSKKFLVSNFNTFKIVDERPVREQFRELERILNHFTQHNLHMDETIIVSSIIDKLPPSWKEFKRTLKHKIEDISLGDLANHICVEEECRMQENEKEQYAQEFSKVHVAEAGQAKNQSHKRPFNKAGGSTKPKFKNQSHKRQKITCWFCGKNGHFKSDCHFWKRKKGKKSFDAVNNATNDDQLIVVLSEINIIENDMAWWIDSGVSRHVCNNKRFFKTMKAVDEDTVLYMGNSTTIPVKGIGNVELKFTSRKIVTLTNVFYVPEVRKNLVSGSLLNKFGFRLVFEADKFVLSKGGMFMGKGYACEGMFKLNVLAISNKNVVSAYIVESSLFLWHHRLGHINFRKLYDMVNLELFPFFNKSEEKCNTCMKTKITRNPFPKVERNSKLLELIHFDICDMHSTPSIGGKKYFITFIDDYSKFCYVYLLHSKDEALIKFQAYKADTELHCETFIKCLRSDRGGEIMILSCLKQLE